MDGQTTAEREGFAAALRDFKRSVEITRDVRFQANLRLIRRQRWSSYMVSVLSLYVIALSLLPNIINLSEQKSQILLAASVILSVFVIFTSLIDGAQNFYYQGELLHRCARKVATVHHELKNIDASKSLDEAKSQLIKLQENYREALDECPINHENVDYAKIQTTKPHLFPDNYYKKWLWPQIQYKKLLYHFNSNSWMVPHLIALGVVSVIVYCFVLASAG